MRRLAYLCLVPLAACVFHDDDYGPPTATTVVNVDDTGGFAPVSQNHGVHITGTTAMYYGYERTETVTIAESAVADIIAALEHIHFLDLAEDYESCRQPATDQANVDFAVSLDAGDHHVTLYLGCSGGTYDRLRELEQTIFDESGFTAWAQLD